MTHPCDICRSTESEPLKQFPAAEICQNCGFIYVPERRSHEEIIEDWRHAYANEDYDPTWPAVSGRLLYVAQTIRSVVRPLRTFDFGGGQGEFQRLWQQMSYGHIMTYDPAGTVGDEDPHNSDVVTINWALENSVDCNQMLQDASEHLRDYGVLFIATGSRILVHPRKPMGEYFSNIAAPDLHCFRFSFNSLRNVLIKNGFLPFYVNRYQDHDVLLMGAIKSPLNHDMSMVYDDPKRVQEFFDQWEHMSEWLAST